MLFIILLAGSAVYGSDPADIGAGARAIGMGKVSTVLDGDLNCVFGNPAGLASIRSPGLTSMFGEMTSDVNYSMLGGVYPLAGGTLGIAKSSISAGDIIRTTLDAYGRVSGTGTFNFTNDLYSLNYGAKYNKRLSYGIRLKYYQKGASSIAGGESTGFNTDLGLLYEVDDNLSFGMSLSNFLKGGMGALNWGNGYSEELPSKLEMGIGYRLLDGNIFADLSSQKGFPVDLRAGGEWNVTDNLTLRAGLEQRSQSMSEAYNNYSAGVGFKAKGFSIDYAYYYDGLLPYNSRHFIGVSFAMPVKKRPSDYITIDSGDRIVTEKDRLTINGHVGREVKSVMIDGNKYQLRSGSFEATVPIKVGKNKIMIRAFDKKNRLLAEIDDRALRLVTFKDVPDNFSAKAPITNITTMLIVKGIGSSKAKYFFPRKKISREEMVAVLARSSDMKEGYAPRPIFKDVPPNRWSYHYVMYAVDRKWIGGYKGNVFRPINSLKRAEGLKLLMQFDGMLPADAYTGTQFTDVKTNFWASKWIQSAWKEGLLRYMTSNKFEPEKKLTRAEAFDVLSRTKYISEKIKELYNFDKGY